MFEIIIPLVFTFLAYWRNEPVLKVIAGFMLMFLGFDYWDTNWMVSILLGVAGIYTFIRAFIKTAEEAKK